MEKLAGHTKPDVQRKEKKWSLVSNTAQPAVCQYILGALVQSPFSNSTFLFHPEQFKVSRVLQVY